MTRVIGMLFLMVMLLTIGCAAEPEVPEPAEESSTPPPRQMTAVRVTEYPGDAQRPDAGREQDARL
jgi:hypothetical protein